MQVKGWDLKILPDVNILKEKKDNVMQLLQMYF
jgi:hypothetical protein